MFFTLSACRCMVLADMKIPPHSWSVALICVIVGFWFSAEVLLQISFVRGVTLCHWASSLWRFQGSCCLFHGLIDLEDEGAVSLQNIGKHSPSSTVSCLRRLESSDEQLWHVNQSVLVCNWVLYVLIIKHHAVGVFCCCSDKHILLYVLLYAICRGIFLSLLMKQLFWISGQAIWPKCTKSCTACLWERAVRRRRLLWWAVCWIYCPVLSPSCPRSKKQQGDDDTWLRIRFCNVNISL
jgi:hypothetical protein